MTNRLLIIDDDAGVAEVVSLVANDEIFDVEVTTRAADFMAAVLRSPPDVIVLDIFMPDMDGVELIQWLAKQHSAARVIVVTGFDPSYGQMVKEIGIANGIASITILLKPFTIATLEAALEAGAVKDRDAGG